MRLTVLGGCGAWPEAGQACSGYLVEHDGFRLLVDAGYATVPRLLQRVRADQVDAVVISQGHPDHCADLSPLLRARALAADPPAALPVYALPGALDAVLALDRPGMLAGAYLLHQLGAGSHFGIGPFHAETRLLPHRPGGRADRRRRAVRRHHRRGHRRPGNRPPVAPAPAHRPAFGTGRSNAEVGAALHLSPETARTYVSRLLTTLGARDRAKLVVIAYETGLVRPGDSAP